MGKHEKDTKEKQNGGPRSISFSLKPREVEVPVTPHTTFPIESSSSEEDPEATEEEVLQHKLLREKRREERRIQREREIMLKKEKQLLKEDSSDNEDLYDIFKYGEFYSKNIKF